MMPPNPTLEVPDDIQRDEDQRLRAKAHLTAWTIGQVASPEGLN